MKIDKSFWQKNREYEFSCTVTEYTKFDESTVRGTATKYFSTSTFPGPLNLIVAPSIGLPFETEFLLETNHRWSYPIKCQFGYENLLGRVVLDE
jgi:hypothetical protein